MGKEEKLSKRNTKFLSEYFLDRDWLNERPMWDDAQREVDDEIKLSIGWPVN